MKPTLAAMLGSIAFHGFLAASSQLAPSTSKPDRLRIVSIAPSPTGRLPANSSSKAALRVPAVLPPISLSQVPKLWTFPNPSKLTSKSQTFLSGPIIPSVDLTQIKALDLFGKSPFKDSPSMLQGLSEPKSSAKSPESLMSKAVQANNFDDLLASRGSGQMPAVQAQQTDQQQTAGFSQNQPPQTIPSPIANAAATPPAYTPAPTPKIATKPSESSAEWKVFQQWLQTHSYLTVQELSAQSGPTLTADYPPEACAVKQKGGTAVIAALYGPDGNFADGNDAIKVITPLPLAELNQAARAAVSKYHPPAAEGYQAFKFNVEIPYSADVCPKSKPSPTTSPVFAP